MSNTFRDSKTFVNSVLLGIILLGTFLRLYHLNNQSIWGDEAIALTVSHAPLDKIVTYFRKDGAKPPLEWNPPIYHYALHGWLRIFGFGVFQARLMSALAGILCLPLVFLIARRLYDKNTALLATLLTAVSQVAIRYSQEIRPYELAFLFFLATVYFFLIATDKQSLSAWIWCTVFAVSLVGTHYYAALGIISLGVYSMLFWKARSVPLTWITGSGITGFVVVAPWLALVLKGQVGAASHPQPPWFAVNSRTLFRTINNFNNGLISGFERSPSAPRWTYVVGALLFTGPVAVMVWRWLKNSRDTVSSSEKNNTALLFILWALPVIIVLAFGWLASIPYDVRYVAFVIAPYYILASAGIFKVRSAALRWTIVIISLCYSGYALRADYFIPYKENYRDAAAYVSERSQVGDCYAFVPETRFEWTIYAPSLSTRFISPGHELPTGPGCRRIWVISNKRVDALPPMFWREPLEKVKANFRKSDDKQFFWVGVELYTAPTSEGP